jgi:hypothetical protein
LVAPEAADIGVPRLRGPITNAARERRSEMPLTADFKEKIQERARADATFREALLKEAVDALLSEDMETGKTILRDYINATVGFGKLATVTKITEEPHAHAGSKR